MLQPRDLQDGSTDLATLRGLLAAGALPEEVYGPMLAGARSRRVADLCDAMMIPALLIDRTGRVLHATALGLAAISGVLKVASGHVLACNSRADGTLQSFLSDALANGIDAEAVTIGPQRRCVSLAAVAASDSSPYQLLHTVVVLGRTGSDARGAADKLATGLSC